MCAPSGDCPPRLPVAPQPLGAARRMPAVLNRTAGAQAGVRAPPGRPRVARSACARRRGRKGGRRGRAGRLRRRAGRAGSELVVTVKKMTTLDTTASASCAQKLTQPMRLRAAAPRCSRARPGQQGAAARTAACRVARRASAGAQRTGWPRPPSRWCPRPQRGRPWLPPAPPHEASVIICSASTSAPRQMQTPTARHLRHLPPRGALDSGDAPAGGVPQAPEPAQTAVGRQVWSQPEPYGQRRLACTARLAEARRPGA